MCPPLVINSFSVSSGETAFKNMTDTGGWAQRPMLQRMEQLQPHIPMTIIYGSRSSIDSISADSLRERRPHSNVDMIVSSLKLCASWLMYPQSDSIKKWTQTYFYSKHELNVSPQSHAVTCPVFASVGWTGR